MLEVPYPNRKFAAALDDAPADRTVLEHDEVAAGVGRKLDFCHGKALVGHLDVVVDGHSHEALLDDDLADVLRRARG